MKKLILIMLLALGLSAEAKFTESLSIKYQTQRGWSKYYDVDVTFMTGYELNQATRSNDYSMYQTYGIVWWGSGQCTIIKLSIITSCGYYTTHQCLSAYYYLEGFDQDGDRWYICKSNVCY
jgi:hypothetical protein